MIIWIRGYDHLKILASRLSRLSRLSKLSRLSRLSGLSNSLYSTESLDSPDSLDYLDSLGSIHSIDYLSSLDPLESLDLDLESLSIWVCKICIFHSWHYVSRSTLYLFLHIPFCRAEGLCQQAAIKVRHGHKMLNEPIRAKHVIQYSSVIGWQNQGQANTNECTLA